MEPRAREKSQWIFPHFGVCAGNNINTHCLWKAAPLPTRRRSRRPAAASWPSRARRPRRPPAAAVRCSRGPASTSAAGPVSTVLQKGACALAASPNGRAGGWVGNRLAARAAHVAYRFSSHGACARDLDTLYVCRGMTRYKC